MKSFFKKLSLVLVAAMVLTLIPAQNAKAAGTIKLAPQEAKSVDEAITVLTLKKGETADLKFYGCLDYKTTGEGWDSSVKAVATVDKNGVVTAVAAGATEVVYTAKGYTTEPVVVVVTDDYTVDLADQDTAEVIAALTLKAGETKDLKFIGAKGYSVAKNSCKWVSTNTAVATVDKVGNVTAVADGEACIVLTIIDKATGEVAFAVAPVAVTVKTNKLEVAQKTYNTAELTFNGEAVDTAALEVVSVAMHTDDTTEIKEYVNVEGKKVTFYNDIQNGKKYIFRANGQEASFVGSVGAVADFEIKYFSYLNGNGAKQYGVAYENTDITIEKGNFVDANGIGVNTAGFSFQYEDKYVDANGDEVITNFYDDQTLFIGKGTTHFVTITVVDANNNVVTSKTSEAIVAVAPEAWKIVSVDYRLGADALNPEFGQKDYAHSSTSMRLSIDDEDYYGLSAQLVDNYGNKWEFNAGDATNSFFLGCDAAGNNCGNVEENLNNIGQFLFESSNPNKISVTDEGILEAQDQGTATIFCYFETFADGDAPAVKKLLKTVTVKVEGHRVPTTVTMTESSNVASSKGYIRLSDEAGACEFNTGSVKFVVKDQFDRELSQAVAGGYGKYQLTAKVYDQNTGKQIADDEYVNRLTLGTGAGDFAWDAVNQKYDVTLTSKALAIESVDINDGNPDHTVNGAMVNFNDAKIWNTRFNFFVSANGVSKQVVLNVAEFNIDEITPDVDPATIWCRKDTTTEIGNTGIYSEDAGKVGGWVNAEYAFAHIVDVHAASGSYVYGYDYANDILSYNDKADVNAKIGVNKSVKNLSASELRTFAEYLNATVASDETATAVFVDFIVNGKSVEGALVGDALTFAGHNTYKVMVRKAFANLADGKAYDDGSAHADARALSEIANVTVDVNLYRITNSNTNVPSQTSTTWNRRTLKYDDAKLRTLTNEDAKRFDAQLTFKDLFYEGDIPGTQASWQAWFTDHAQLTIKWDAVDGIWVHAHSSNNEKNEAICGARPNDTGITNFNTGVESFFVKTMNTNSKYIQYIEVWFLDDTAALTYAKINVGKKITPWNYGYKYEVVGDDDTEGI